MSFKVLRYVASKGGEVEIKEITEPNTNWDKGLRVYATRDMEDILRELTEENLIYNPNWTGNVKLTDKGKEVAALLGEQPQQLAFSRIRKKNL